MTSPRPPEPSREDAALVALLRGIDAPRSPRSDFDARLRSELFGGSPAAAPSDADPGRPAPTPPCSPDEVLEPEDPERASPARPTSRLPVVLGVAALILAIVAVAAVVRADRPPQVVVSGPDGPSATTTAATLDDGVTTTTAPTLDVEAATGACTRMQEEAFAPLTRSQVLGPTNAQHLTSPDEAFQAATRLLLALERWQADLAAAGVDDDRVTASLDVAAAEVDGAARWVRRGDGLERAIDILEGAERPLIGAERRLVELGVPGCA